MERRRNRYHEWGPFQWGPFLGVLLLFTNAGGSSSNRQRQNYCPTRCECTPATGAPETVVCANAELQVIPHDLPGTVTVLSLRGNRIRSVESILSAYAALTHLQLSQNEISVVQRRSFSQLRRLNFLDLSDNELGTLAYDAFEGLSSLRELHLSKNNLGRFPLGLFSVLPELELLDLSSNRLSVLQVDIFKGANKLKTLILDDNFFTKVPSDSFPPIRYLNKLSLSGNSFVGGIESADFLLLTMLTELEVNGCGLGVIPDDAFYGLAQHLALLDLGNNGLQRIPTGALAPLKKLRTLHVGLNEFTEIESNALESLPNLRDFTVVGCGSGVNRLIIKGGAFRNNPLLETVNITKCHGFYSVPSGTFDSQLHLSTINLSGNQIRTLDEDVADWRSISHLDVSGNPFECDCRVAWLNELLRESPGLPRPHCYAPQELEQRKELGAMSSEEMDCGGGSGNGGADRGATNAAVIAVAVICSVLTLGLLAYGCYYLKRHPTARERLRMRRRRLRGGGKGDEQPINKADIQVVPSTELIDCNKYFDVVKVASVENIYEELPTSKEFEEVEEEEEAKYENVLQPPRNNNFPDVKISVL